MRFTERVAIRLKTQAPSSFILRTVYRMGMRLKNILNVSAGLVWLLPEFYRVYANNRRGNRTYKVRNLVDELKKVASWHSIFLGLIDFWELSPEFNEFFGRASKAPSGVNITRGFMLYQFLKQIDNLDGNVAEVGVYKGRSAKLIALTVEKQNKHVYLFDTFAGLPEVNPEKDNYHQKGDFNETSLAEVQEFLADCKNITIYPGFFPDTAEPIRDKKFCFAHIDVDIYRSVLDCCQFFYPRLASGGMMVFDDPGFVICAGAKIAIDEFFTNKEEFPIHLATGQVLVIKH